MKPPLFLLLAALASASAFGEDTTTSIPFSDPAQPGRLRAVISHGAVHVRGGDVDAVTIRSSATAENRSQPREDGLRVIATAAQFTASEAENVVTIEYGLLGRSSGAEFHITVPRSTTVQLQSNFGGQISVEDLDGDVEIKNMNGEIQLRSLRGGALVETMNGEIDAVFAALPSGKPLAFTSMNGEVKLRVPADARANVRFRTQNGTILTDFPSDVLVTKMEPGTSASYGPVAAEVARAAADAAREAMQVAMAVADEVREAVETEVRAASRREARGEPPRPPRAPRPPSIPPMAGGKVVSGTLNGGGTEIQVATMNGDIVVRRTPASP